MTSETIQMIDLLAGTHPNGQPVIEKVPAVITPQQYYQLRQSPLFVQGAARGDSIELLRNNPGRFRVRERSGQLAVRVLHREGIESLAEELTPALEKLGATLDVQSARALVYSIHVAVGFTEIEGLIEPLVQAAGATWSYGNVYSSTDGTPLRWWEYLLNP